MKILLILVFCISQVFAQSHTGTFDTDDEAGALTCEKHASKTAKFEEELMLKVKRPYKGTKSFLAFVDNFFIRENIKFLNMPLPFGKLRPSYDCSDEDSLKLLKKILGMYQVSKKHDWKCLDTTAQIGRIPSMKKIIKYYEK